MQLGECLVGGGVNAAHINTVLGERTGPVGTAWATALATPSAGHAPFVACLRPSLAVQPPTLLVTKSALIDERHSRLFWGAAQVGVAGGVADAIAAGVIDRGIVDSLVIIAAVWLNPDADDDDTVYTNNREATLGALRAGAAALPSVDDVLDGRHEPGNPFYEPPR